MLDVPHFAEAPARGPAAPLPLSPANRRLLKTLWRMSLDPEPTRVGIRRPERPASTVRVSAAVRLDALAGYVEIVEAGSPRLVRFTALGLKEATR